MTPGSTDDLRDLEAALADALRADADRITPGDRLAAIQAATAVDVPTRRRGPRLFTLVAAAAAAAVVGSVAAGQWLGGGATGRPGGTVSVTEPAAPAPSSASTAGHEQTVGQPALPVYFAAPTDVSSRQSWLLTRTFVKPAAGTPADSASRIKAALNWAMTSESVYPIADSAPPWEDMAVEKVEVTDDLITITLAHGGHGGRWTQQAEQAVISMFVWTAQAVVGHGRVPVTFVLADGATMLFDRFPASDRYDRPATGDLAGVVAPVWIDLPGIDQTLSSGKPVSVRGLALDPSTVLSWRVLDANGLAAVAQGTTTTDAARPQASFAFTLDSLPPGAYYLTIRTPGQGASPDRLSAGTTTFFLVG